MSALLMMDMIMLMSMSMSMAMGVTVKCRINAFNPGDFPLKEPVLIGMNGFQCSCDDCLYIFRVGIGICGEHGKERLPSGSDLLGFDNREERGAILLINLKRSPKLLQDWFISKDRAFNDVEISKYERN